MDIKNYKIWESTRGDGVQEEDYFPSKPIEINVSNIIVSIPSGEVIQVDDVNDFKELSQKKLITYFKYYKSRSLFCFCCEDQDVSKVKYLVDEFRRKRNKSDGFKPIAREFREQIRKSTNRLYAITYNKNSDEFTAIIPDLNSLTTRQLEDIESICIRFNAKYPNFDFQSKIRNLSFIGLEYLKTND